MSAIDTKFPVLELRWSDQEQEKLRQAKKLSHDTNIVWAYPEPPRVLYQFNRLLEEPYRNLAWPAKIQHIAIRTPLAGGRGDSAAAVKVMQALQKICPALTFDWIVNNSKDHDPASFLKELDDPTKVVVFHDFPTKKSANFFITGPSCSGGFGVSSGFNFLEIGYHNEYFKGFFFDAIQTIREQANRDKDLYQKTHKILYAAGNRPVEVVMGLLKGTGVFLDESRINAPLSYGVSCPRYLFRLEDRALRQDIFASFGIQSDEIEPSYEKHSLNFGYAHLCPSWKRFIDFVALHEREKDVTIVLNQNGHNNPQSRDSFREKIFTLERLAFLKKWGYGKVILKGDAKEPLILQDSSNSHERTLTVILRPSFSPSDMKHLQLASERHLATGDNSPAEAWASRCIMYVYEIMNSKVTFLNQQCQIVKSISPDVAKLLYLFSSRSEDELTQAEMSEAIELLQRPTIATGTLEFCKHVIENFSFNKVLEAALKRTAWHQCIPGLIDLEAETLDEEFKASLINFLGCEEAPPQSVALKSLTHLAEKIQHLISHSS